MHELQLHEVAQFGEREGLAVVALERRFPTRSPCEQVVGLKLYCLDVKQFFCKYFLKCVHIVVV